LEENKMRKQIHELDRKPVMGKLAVTSLGSVFGLLFSVNCANDVYTEAINRTCTPGVVTSQEALPVIRVNPYYPLSAQQDGTDGWVEMEADINKDGRPENIRVLDSTPPEVFDSAAVAGFSQWQYCPARTGVSYENPIRVRLAFEVAPSSLPWSTRRTRYPPSRPPP
jgi:TonB family protein